MKIGRHVVNFREDFEFLVKNDCGRAKKFTFAFRPWFSAVITYVQTYVRTYVRMYGRTYVKRRPVPKQL